MTAREITAVLMGHPLYESHDERFLDLCGGCVWSGRGRVEHAEHVAELIEEQQ